MIISLVLSPLFASPNVFGHLRNENEDSDGMNDARLRQRRVFHALMFGVTMMVIVKGTIINRAVAPLTNTQEEVVQIHVEPLFLIIRMTAQHFAVTVTCLHTDADHWYAIKSHAITIVTAGKGDVVIAILRVDAYILNNFTSVFDHKILLRWN